jgi:hypothetical protein
MTIKGMVASIILIGKALAIAILKIVNFARIEITQVTKSTCHKPKGPMLT